MILLSRISNAFQYHNCLLCKSILPQTVAYRKSSAHAVWSNLQIQVMLPSWLESKIVYRCRMPVTKKSFPSTRQGSISWRHKVLNLEFHLRQAHQDSKFVYCTRRHPLHSHIIEISLHGTPLIIALDQAKKISTRARTQTRSLKSHESLHSL